MTERLRIVGGLLLIWWALSQGGGVTPGPGPIPAPDDRHRVMVVYSDGMPREQATVAASARWSSWASSASAEFRRVEQTEDTSRMESEWRALRAAATSPPQVVIAKGGRMRVTPIASSWEAMEAELNR